MATLRWSVAARIARRELSSSRSKFFFVVLSVAIGVAALTGVRGFASAFRQTLSVRARSLLAADLSARMWAQPSPGEQQALTALAASGIRSTPITEMAGMATAAGSFDPLLVELKSVDPAEYPYYGHVDLAPAMPLPQALASNGVAVGEDFLIRLKLHVGDSIRLGNATFRITSVVSNEPDRLSSAFAVGPRVLLSRPELDATELLEPGSRSSQRYLFKLPQQSDAAVAKLRAKVEAALPQAQVTDFRETNPAVTTALDRSTELLSLVSLVALVLGAVGVAMSMRAHLLERMDSIATMKSLGAQSTHILRIYLIETLLLGAIGGIVGAVLGFGVERILPLLLSRFLGMSPELHLSVSSVVAGFAMSIAVTMLFTLPLLLDIRKVRPAQVLRRSMDERETHSLWTRLRGSGAQIVGLLVALAGIAAVATWLSGSRQVGVIFSLGTTVAIVVLMLAATGLLALLRVVLRRSGMRMPPVLRHGLANLYRPGNPSAALLAALGLGVMLVVAVFLVQQSFVNDLKISTRADLPDVFLVDIAKSEVSGVRDLLRQQPGVSGTPELLPVVGARILSIDGTASRDLKLKNYPAHMLQSTQITWSDQLPTGSKVVDGQFWQQGETGALLSVEEHRAERLHLHVGSRLVFGIGDGAVDTTVIAIVRNDGQHVFSRADFILPPAVLQNAPVVWYGGVHIDPAQVGALQRTLFERYPTVTVINVAQALENLRAVLLQVTLVVQFLAAFSIFAGLVILASSIAGTRYRRVREVVVLKTLGGTRSRIAAIFSVEFSMLGVVAGVIGVLFANVVARAVLGRMTLPWVFHPAISLAAVAITALCTVGAGWSASYRVLGQKPLEVLREE